MKKRLSLLLLGTLILSSALLGQPALADAPRAGRTVVWLDDLNLSGAKQTWGEPHAKKSVSGYDLSVGGETFDHGFGTHAISTLNLKLDGNAKKFTACVGVDDNVTYPNQPRVYFYVIGDGKVLWKSGIMQLGDLPRPCEVDLTGVTQLSLLVGDANPKRCFCPANWGDAKFEIAGQPPVALQ